MGNALSQSIRIPAPILTQENLPDQSGKVHIVTGGYAGVGLELTKILYARNATVFVAGRSPEKATTAIEQIKQHAPSSTGKVEFLKLDLADLTTIKASANDLIARTDRLDVLTNNAGVMMPPPGSKTAQGHELQVGTNCLGPFLFTELLVPLLKKTAASSPAGSVRVTWAASVATELSPKGGVPMNDDGSPQVPDDNRKAYSITKVANIFLATETARRYGGDGIVSVAWNPGNLNSELQRHMAGLMATFTKMICYPPIFGGYTELYAACSPDIKLENNGAYVVPWGRIGSYRADIAEGVKGGKAEKFWGWCERETKEYA
ncbi:Short chain dehydrogenase-like protein 43 [Elsinoe fawcettii]|nr:Short chain dehydrogenase-like protein 43 [Elsinoe fawcettii]